MNSWTRHQSRCGTSSRSISRAAYMNNLRASGRGGGAGRGGDINTGDALTRAHEEEGEGAKKPKEKQQTD